MTEIRLAISDDSPHICTIIQEAFHEDSTLSHVSNVIQSGKNTVFTALLDDQVVAFLSGFTTFSHDRAKRWEMDLLAVHPDYQARGLGKKLIQTATDYAKKTENPLIRALVASDNLPMQHAMTHCGYEKQAATTLYVSSVDNIQFVEAPASTHLMPVTTLTYHGIWIEGAISQQSINAALSQKTQTDADIVGAVVEREAQQSINLLQKSGFEKIKDFDWWHKAL